MKVLLLAGTREARDVAAWLHAEDVPSIASFAGVTREPELPAIETRLGGFGGRDAFAAYLVEHQITHILDATHPFAAAMSARAHAVGTEQWIAYCQLLRPPWEPQHGDRWTPLAREEDAASHIEEDARVFLATGRQTLSRFAGMGGRYLICRQIDPPDRPFPFPNGEYLVGRPPFSVADEVALFRKLRVDWLIVKNAGGRMSATKLIAARQLSVPVAMIERPTQPPGEKVSTVEEAISWLSSQRG
ncbi:MAG: cobalt-precorrin-6A reductase [Pseudomonadota bacterium]